MEQKFQWGLLPLMAVFVLLTFCSSPDNGNEMDGGTDAAIPDTPLTDSEGGDVSDLDLTDVSDADAAGEDVASSKQVFFVLQVHTGEGDASDDCMMFGTTTISGPNYLNCRNGLKDIALKLGSGYLSKPDGTPVNIKAHFEFHPRFMDLLAEDQEGNPANFDFSTDIAHYNHKIALHNHYECHISVDSAPFVCKNPDAGGWGRSFVQSEPNLKPTVRQWEIALTTYTDHVFQIHPFLTTFNFDLFNSWGNEPLVKNPGTDRDYVIEHMVNAGMIKTSSHQTVMSSYSEAANPFCYAAESDDSQAANALVHKALITNSGNTQSLTYYDGRPILFGQIPEEELNLKIPSFENLLKCQREEQDPTRPYFYIATVHLHNLIHSANAAYTWQGLADLQTFVWAIENLAAQYGVTIVYATIDEI